MVSLEDVSWGPVWGGLFFVALGSFFIKESLKNYKDYEPSENWPHVSGTMTQSEVWRPNATESRRIWSVEYTYEVEGKQYTGHRSALYTPVYKEILEWQDGRKEGDTVKVYYKPENPEESVLITGGRSEKKAGEIILSVTATLVGVAVMVAGALGYIG